MPGRDKSGPSGNGAATGRGMGGCRGAQDNNSFAGNGLGRSFRKGNDQGPRRRRFFNRENSGGSIETMLKNISDRLAKVESRLNS